MAGKTLEYDLKVLDKSKSMQQRTKDAKEYNNELSRSEKLMQQSRRAAYKQESVDYGATRALAMGTGASGRDFAKEAQGLGGLVRLYATFAANIFAVTAAFQQLSKAMDTTNMVRGMEQLGAQSGIALVNISKNLVATTDYAISMREAMEATAMATSAGLSAQQLQDVGLVAKNVSQALGRDVVDSITRLTRGIVKLEPELLDELGLFTKIGPATEKYALSIGKSASQLTDFERRQAFANAVIKEGLDKFSSIKLEANPYSKLLATLKDVAQAGLELINKTLTPLIKLLSESPTALAAILAGIAISLTKQALPAIANFNQAMRDSAKEAVEAATKRALMVEKVLKREVSLRKAAADAGAEAESMRWEATTQRLEALAKDRAERIAKASRSKEGQTVVQGILQKSVAEITATDLATLDQLGKRQTKVAGLYRELADAKREYDKEAQNYEAGRQAAEKYYNSQQSLLTTTGRLFYQVQQENQRARSAEITSNAAATTSLLGVRAAWKQLNDDIAKARSGPQVKIIKELDDAGKETGNTFEYTVDKMSAFRAGTTRLVGSIKIVTQALASAVGFLGTWAQIIAIVGTTIGGLYSYFAKATEALDKFDKTIDDNLASIKNLKDTVNAIFDKAPSRIFESASISAQANAVNGLADSLKNMRKAASDAYSELDNRGNIFEKIWEGLKMVVGQGIDQRAMTNISSSIVQQIDALSRTSMGLDTLAKYGRILGVEDPSQNIDKVVVALKKLSPNSKVITYLSDAWQEYADRLKVAQREQENFTESLKKTDESFQRFMQQYAINDPLTRFVIDATKSLGDFSKLIASPNIEQNLGGILQLLDKMNSIPFFSGEQQQELQQAAMSIRQLNTDLGNSSKIRDDLIKKRSIAGEKLAELGTDGPFASSQKAQDLRNEMQDLTGRILDESVKAQKYQQGIRAEADKFIQSIPQTIGKYTQYFSNIIQATLAKGATQYQQYSLSKITEFLPEAAERVAQLKVQEINTQINLIDTNLQLIATIKESDAQRRALEYERSINEARSKMDILNIAAGGEPGDPKASVAARTNAFGPVITVLQQNIQQFEKYLKEAQGESQAYKELAKRPGVNIMDLIRSTGASPGIASALQEFASNQAGGRQQRNVLRQQAQIESSEGRLARLDAELNLTKRINELTRQGQDLADERTKTESTLKDLFAEERAIIEDSASKAKIIRDYEKELEDIEIRRKNAQARIDEAFKGKLTSQQMEQAGIAQSNLNTEISLAKQNAERRKGNKELDLSIVQTNRLKDINYEVSQGVIETNNKLDDIQYSLRSERLDTESQISQILHDRGLLLDNEYQLLKKSEAIRKVQLETERDRLRINRDADAKLAALEKRRYDKDPRLTEEGYKIARDGIESVRKAELAAATEGEASKLKLIDLNNELSSSQEKYRDLLKGTVDSLTDAIVNFAKGSKTAFKDFIYEALAGLLKLQLQLTLMEPLKQSLMSRFFPSAIAATGTTAAATSTPFYLPGAAAKGALFTSSSAMFAGMDKYAKGGLLNSPTLFAHSGGSRMAVAGEAGPEFVMPAVKTSNGSFGLRATGGKTEINIYNNTQANVEAKETVDSRGNRSFDVIISEMVAGNMAQPGSPMQNSLRGNYGLSPALVRR